MNRIALVTGTSTGIGVSAATMLAQAGFTVVATMRDTEKRGPLGKRAETDGVTLDVRRLDVQDENSIAECVRGVLDAHGRIDVLVNNAGAGHLGSMEQVSDEALARTMDINFFGVWRVTRSVFPVMREQGAGRIISVTSIGGLIGQPFNDAYCAAKFAVEGFMESLAPVAKRLGVHLSLIEPGPVNTEFIANVKQSVDPALLNTESPYAPLLQAYLAGTTQAFASIGQTPDDIGKVIVEAAVADQPQFRYPTSELVGGFISKKYVDPTGDSVVAMAGARLP